MLWCQPLTQGPQSSLFSFLLQRSGSEPAQPRAVSLRWRRGKSSPLPHFLLHKPLGFPEFTQRESLGQPQTVISSSAPPLANARPKEREECERLSACFHNPNRWTPTGQRTALIRKGLAAGHFLGIQTYLRSLNADPGNPQRPHSLR